MLRRSGEYIKLGLGAPLVLVNKTLVLPLPPRRHLRCRWNLSCGGQIECRRKLAGNLRLVNVSAEGSP